MFKFCELDVFKTSFMWTNLSVSYVFALTFDKFKFLLIAVLLVISRLMLFHYTKCLLKSYLDF